MTDKRFDSRPKSKKTHKVKTHKRKLKDGRIVIIPEYLRGEPHFDKRLKDEDYYGAAQYLWNYRSAVVDETEAEVLKNLQRDLMTENVLSAKGDWKAKGWKKKGRNAWKLDDYEVRLFKIEGERFYTVDLWWVNPKTGVDYNADIDGATHRGDAVEIAEEFMAEENPRLHFIKANRFILEDIGFASSREEELAMGREVQ